MGSFLRVLKSSFNPSKTIVWVLFLLGFIFLFNVQDGLAAGCTGTGSCYWVGGTGNTNDTTKWATTSGGATTGGLPSATDNCIFDSASNATAYTATINASLACKNISFAAPLAGDMTLAGSAALGLTGTWTGYAGLINSYTGTITMSGAAGPYNITSAGVAFGASIAISTAGAGTLGEYDLADNLVLGSTNTLNLTQGIFDAKTFNVTTGLFSTSGTSTRTLTMGSGTWTLTGSGTIWTTVTNTNLTLDAGTSTVLVTDSSASAKTISFGTTGPALYDISIASGAAGTVAISGCTSGACASFHNLTVAATGASAVYTQSTSNVILNFNNVDFTGFTGSWTQSGTTAISGNLTLSGTMTWAGAGAVTLSTSNLTLPVGLTRTSTSGITFTATVGTQTITSNGIALANAVTKSGVGGTLSFVDAFVTTGVVTLTSGTLDANNQNLTMGSFSSTNSNTRAITMGSGTWALTSSGTIWATTTSTNLTLNVGTSTVLVTDSSTTTKTLSFPINGTVLYDLSVASGSGGSVSISGCSSGGCTFNDITIAATGTSAGFTMTATNVNPNVHHLNFTGFTGTWTTHGPMALSGDLTLSSAMTWAGTAALTLSASNLTLPVGLVRTYTGGISFTATVGTQNLTINGITLASAISKSGAGTLSFVDAFENRAALTLTSGNITLGAEASISGTFTLTAGTFDASNQNVTLGAFSSSNSNVRTLSPGSGTWTLTGTVVIWLTTTDTNLTYTTNPKVLITDTSATTKTISNGPTAAFQSVTVASNAGGTVALSGVGSNFGDVTDPSTGASAALVFANSGSSLMHNFDLSGFTGTWSTGSGVAISGDMTLGASMTRTWNGAIAFSSTSAQTITSNGITLASNITKTGDGGTLTFADAFENRAALTLTSGNITLGAEASISGTFTLTAGTFDAGNQNVTLGAFSSSNSNVRTLTMGSGTWTLMGTGVVWVTTTNTNLTLNAGSSTLIISNSSTSSKQFSVGASGDVFNDVTISASTAGTVTLTGGSTNVTFRDFTVAATGTSSILSASFNVALTVRNMDFTGFTGTWSPVNPMTITGNLTLSPTMTRTFAGTLAFTATSGTQTITSNGITLASTITKTGDGGTLAFADAFENRAALTLTSGNITLGAEASISGTFTLTAGTFDAGNQNVTMAIFSSSNSNTRTLTPGTGTWTLTSTGNVWFTTGSSNLTYTTAPNVVVTNSSTTTKTIAAASTDVFASVTIDSTSGGSVGLSGVGTNFGNVTDSATGTSAALATSGASNVILGNLDFTGFTGTWTSGLGVELTGNLTLSPTMTRTFAGTLAFTATSGTQTITSNGITLASTITKTGDGGTLAFADAFENRSTLTLTSGTISLGGTASISGTFTLTSGTLDANNQNVTLGAFSSTGTGTRTLTPGTGTFTLTSTGTVWNTSTSTNLTLTTGPNISITHTSTTAKTISAASTNTFSSVAIASDAGGTMNLNGGANFGNITDPSTGTSPVLTWNTAGTSLGNLDFTGFTGTWSGANDVNISGSLTLVSTATSSYTGDITFNATSGSKTITSAGTTYEGNFIFDGVGGSWSLADDFVTTGTCTITNGTLSLNGHTSTCVVPETSSGWGGLPPEAYSAPSSVGLSAPSQTSTPDVTIAISAPLISGPNPPMMVVSTYPDFRDRGQEPYSSMANIRICSNCIPNKTYTVYAKTYTGWGVSSPVVMADIVYTGEEVTVANGSYRPSIASSLGKFGLREGDVISAQGDPKQPGYDPDVYIVNEHGYKRLFLNQVIFGFYGHLGGFSVVKQVAPSTRDTFLTSGLFRNCEVNAQEVYAAEVTGEDSGILHHVNITGDVAAREDPKFFDKVFCINTNEFEWYPKSPVDYTSVSQVPKYERAMQ